MEQTQHRFRALLVIELMGRPAEHVEKTLNDLIDRLGNEKGVELVKRNIHPAKPTENNLFISFAELEALFLDIHSLLSMSFAYMPSHVEVIEPSSLSINLNDANSIINTLLLRLHNYDDIAKRFTVENLILQNQLIKSGIRPAIPSVNLPNESSRDSKNIKKAKSEGKKKSRKIKKSAER